MRNLIGFIKPQEPMGMQMVEGLGAQNQPRFMVGNAASGGAQSGVLMHCVQPH